MSKTRINGTAVESLGSRNIPEENYFDLNPVGGEYGVTAELIPYARIVDYQEKRGTPKQGYYRLVRHPKLRALEARIRGACDVPVVQLYHSPAIAAEELSHALTLASGTFKVVEANGIPARSDWPSNATHVVCSLERGAVRAGAVLSNVAEHGPLLFERARKRGAIPSARDAAWLCGEEAGPQPADNLHEHVCHELRVLHQAPHCSLYPTGMYAVAAAMEAMHDPSRPGVAIMGHLYSDTHVLLSEMPWRSTIEIRGRFFRADDTERLIQALSTGDIGIVFVETVTNPLVEVPDLPRIIQIAKERGVPVLVDNTMASPYNCRPLSLGADAVVESTTKYLSGGNRHGGGAVLTGNLNISTKLVAEAGRLGSSMSGFELVQLKEGLNTFRDRMPRFNANGKTMAEFLRQHPAVGNVWFPSDEECGAHLQAAASVVSFTLADESLEALVKVLEADMPGVAKAPSLGSDQTLLCPYTLLTYYHRDDAYLDAIRLPRHLLRFSVGSEHDLSKVIEGVDKALRKTTS